MITQLALLAQVAVAVEVQSNDIAFRSSSDGVTLSGTVTSPAAGQPIAAVVLLSVAGPDERDMRVGPHRLFGELAERMGAAGIASLRVDDRGVGGSGGDWVTTSFPDRVADACRAAAELQTRFPRTKIGLVGMSEGGGLALHAAASCARVAFVVCLSTPIRDGRQEMDAQLERMLVTAPLADTLKSALRLDARRLLDYAGDTATGTATDSLRSLLSTPRGRMLLPPYRFVPRDPEAQLRFLQSPWYRSQLGYHVSSALAAYQGPLLAIYGALDRTIDVAANHALLARARPLDRVTILPTLNHVLQEARTGLPVEYAQLPAGIADDVTQSMTSFIRGVVR